MRWVSIVGLGVVLGATAAACGSKSSRSGGSGEGGAAGTDEPVGGAGVAGSTSPEGSGGQSAGGSVAIGGAAGAAGSVAAPGGAAGTAGATEAPGGAAGTAGGAGAGAPGGAAGAAGSAGTPGGAAGTAGEAGASGGAAGTAGEAGGGGSGPGGEVVPLYPTVGALWNDYVLNDGATRYAASDTACTWQDGTVAKDSCVHAGEMRVYASPGLVDCVGVTATDSEEAFDWICDDSSGTVRVISTGLRDGKYLSDLIDWTSDPPVWKSMTVTATNGTIDETSPSTEWWSNPIVIDNDGGQLTEPSAVVVVTSASAGGDYSVRAHKVAVVSQPGVTMPGGNNGAGVIDVQDWHFSWIEANIDATGDEYGLAMIAGGSNFGVVRGFTVDGANGDGIWALAPNGKFIDVTATNNGGYGLRPEGSYTEVRNIISTGNSRGISYGAGEEVLIEDVTALDNTSDGLLIGASDSVIRHVLVANSGQHGFDTGAGNLVYDVVVHNCGGDGIRITGSWNTVAHVQVSNVGGRGLFLSGDNVLVDAALHNMDDMGMQDQPGDIVMATTVANSLARGMGLGANVPPSMNVVMNTAVINNGGGITTDADGGDYLFIDVASTDSTSETFGDIYVDGTVTAASFHGQLIITDTYASCRSPNAVGIDELCSPQSPSDAMVGMGSVAGAFVGAPVPDDTNASGATGTAAFEDIIDWTGFERPRRGWGVGGTVLPDITLQGQCAAGEACQIYDFNLSGMDSSPLLDVVALPTGDDAITHVFASAETTCGRFPGSVWENGVCQLTFLKSAYERIGDGIGNENGLCESDETCVHTPNIGAYQGHGALTAAGTIGTGGAIENVELLQYEDNGY